MTWIAACGCDPEGSESLQCNGIGQCQCKDNVEGTKCTQCVDYTYNFPGCSSKNLGLLVILTLAL